MFYRGWNTGSRRRKLIAAAAMVMILCLVGGSRAADLGPHEDAEATNPCRECHNTASGTPALRGWAGSTTEIGTGWTAKPISFLCYMCHGAGGGPLDTGGHAMINFAYHDASHGYDTASDLPPKPDGTAEDISGTGLPYAAGNELECTSCHNVHLSTNRPFNQRGNDALDSFRALCDTCHPGRVNDDSATSYASPGTHAYETHPTRQGFGNVGSAHIKEVGEIAAELKVTIAAAPNYSLGGHLNSDGKFDCQTCHAVHGVLSDGAAGVGELLARDRGPTDDSGNLTICESCHYGGDAGDQVGTTAAGMNNITRSDHPMDAGNGQTGFYPTGAALPAPWVSPGVAANNNDAGAAGFYTVAANGDTPICASCHDTHGGMLGTDLLRGPVAGGWVFGYDTWCFVCHTNAQVIPPGHHSNTGNLSTATGDSIDSQLQCGDCHGTVANGTDWKAHNGFWAFPVTLADTDSAFCEACHSASDPTDLIDPAIKGQSLTEPADFPYSHGTARGSASHYLGDDSGEFGGVIPKETAWTSSGYFSEYGPPSTGGGGDLPPQNVSDDNARLICESCHNILYNDGRANPGNYTSSLKAGWQSNLLLEPYEDDSSGTGDGTGSYGIGSDLCLGCHNASGIHHPLTGDVLSTTGQPLQNGPSSLADQSGAPGALSYPNVDAMDCDSCHRPHDADDDSTVAGPVHGHLTSTDGEATHHILELDTANHLFSGTMCPECHAR